MNIFKRPSFIHGVILGCILLAVGIIAYLTNNLEIIFSQKYSIITGICVCCMFIFVSIQDKKVISNYNYGNAFLSVIIISFTCSFISNLKFPILRTIDSNFPEKVKTIQIKKIAVQLENLPKDGLLNELFSKSIDVMEKSDARKLVPWYMPITSAISITIFNGLLGLIIAIFTRKKVNPSLKSDTFDSI